MLGRDCCVMLRGWLYENPLPNSTSWSSSNLRTPSRPTMRSPENPSKYQQVRDLLACLLTGLCPGPKYSCVVPPFLYPSPVLCQTAFLSNETWAKVVCLSLGKFFRAVHNLPYFLSPATGRDPLSAWVLEGWEGDKLAVMRHKINTFLLL